MFRRYLLWAVLVLFVAACGNSGNGESASADTDISSVKKEVIVKHDSAMARMNDIAKLQKKLQQEITQEDSARYMETYSELQSARDAMMTWMHDFNVPADSGEEAQMRYLKGEYDRITEVDEMMLTAIARAEALLAEKVKN